MKDKKSFAFVYEFLPSVRCAVIVAGWGLWSFETKELAEHCARDINQAQADGIKEAVAERDARIKELETELLESARIHGMGSEREAALKARIAELEKVLVGASEYIEGLAKRTGVLHGNILEIRKALGKGER